jgi:hypothetical protein
MSTNSLDRLALSSMAVEHPTNFIEREVRQLDRLLPWNALWVLEQLNLLAC